MALFGKKKLTLDEIIEGINGLSEEEKAKALEAMQGKTETSENDVEPTKSEVEQTEESGEVEDAVEETAEQTEGAEDTQTEAAPETEVSEETAETNFNEGESATDKMANDNRDEIIHRLIEQVNTLSEQVKSLLELKTLMEDYTSKQADNFGYKGNVLGAKKDYKDMSTEELKAHAMKGI